jgi:hypothetical protein
MPRAISFNDTSRQFLDGTKTVTRRNAWAALKPGTVLMAVEKVQGLKKGEKQKRFGLLRVKDVRREPLNAITQADCVLEGFPDWAPADFIAFYTRERNCAPDVEVTRIEFERIEPPEA